MTYQGLDSDWDGKSDSAEDSDALGGTAAKEYALLGEIGVADLSFDPATQSDLHSRYTDSEAQTAVDGTARSFSSVSVTNAPADSDDAIRQQELTSHADDSGIHHPEYTDAKAQSAIDGTARNFSSVSIQNKAAQVSLDGMITVVSDEADADSSPVLYIDPANTTTPVQDAIDTINNHGRVILPPQIVEEQTTVFIPPEVEIVGWGFGGNYAAGAWNVGSAIKILNADVDCLVIGENGRSAGNRLDEFQVIGPSADDSTVSTGAGLRIKNHMARGYIGRLRFTNLTDSAIWTDGGDLVECFFGTIASNAIDAAYSNRAIYELGGVGWSSSIGTLAGYADNTLSGQMSDGLRVAGVGNIDIGALNLGSDLKAAVVENGGDGAVRIGTINYEPHGSTNDVSAIIYSYGAKNLHIGSTTLRAGTNYDYYAVLDGSGNTYLSTYTPNGSTTHTTNIDVQVANDTTGPIIYEGMSANVANSSGVALSYPVSCLGDLTTVN